MKNVLAFAVLLASLGGCAIAPGAYGYRSDGSSFANGNNSSGDRNYRNDSSYRGNGFDQGNEFSAGSPFQEHGR